MPLALGSTTIARVFLGTSELLNVYRGAMPVFVAPPPAGVDYLLTEDGNRLTLEDGTPLALDGAIDGLPVVTDLDGAEWIFFVQSGATVKCRLSTFAEFVDG